MTMTSNKPRDLAVVSKDDIMERTFDPVATPEELRQRLSRAPLKTARDKFTKKLHVPISTLEWTMDWVFGPGSWSISETSFEEKGPIGKTSGGDTMVGIVVIVKVKAIHPLFQFVTEQVGICSTDYTYGKFRTAFAASQGLAFKNACKKWGKVFGRDLNRELTEELTGKMTKTQALKRWEDDGIKSIKGLNTAMREAEKKYGKSHELNDAFNQYKKEKLTS